MPNTDISTFTTLSARNRHSHLAMNCRLLIAIQEELLAQLREYAQETHVSVSQFVRESVRRNIAAHRKAQRIEAQRLNDEKQSSEKPNSEKQQ